MDSLPRLTDAPYFLHGGGDMGALIRAKNWTNTPLGDPGAWPRALGTMVSVMLENPFPMYIAWGSEYTQLYNDGFRPILGASKHPGALGISSASTFSEIWPTIQPLFDGVLAGRAVGLSDFMVSLHRNGYHEECYFDFSYSPIRLDSGVIGGILVTVIETTNKKKAEDAMREGEERFRSVILKAPVAMCILRGPKHIIELANERMYELWGKSPGELAGKPMFEGLREARDQGFEALLDGVYETGKSFSAFDVPVTLPRAGQIAQVYVNFLFEAYCNPDGTVAGILAVATDSTAQVLARQKIEEVVTDRTRELALANANLLYSNRELAQYAHIASHDLQEPLRKIRTFSEMLGDSLGNHINARTHKFLQKIIEAAERMNKLIRDVLRYSEVDRVQERFETVDLNEIVGAVLEDYELRIEQTHAVLRVARLPTLDAIPLQMTQLFGNLIGNALKFSRKETKPVIEISVAEATAPELAQAGLPANRDYYRIRVADNGIGFNPAYASQIFNIFQRLHTGPQFEGTGIGLALCKKIVINHQGTISATESSLDGAVFVVLLPARQSRSKEYRP